MSKAGLESSECEDAIGASPSARRFAVADGAAEGFDSRAWAKLLARCWVRAQIAPLSEDAVRSWLAALGDRQHDRWRARQLSWYAEEKASRGSFAALVGIQFAENEKLLSWKAVALGDSCLIHKRGHQIVESFPLSDPEAFNNRPVLVPSLPSLQGLVIPRFAFHAGVAEAGDAFLLMTDALAAWYLKLFRDGDSVVGKLESLLLSSDDSGLQGLLQEARDSRLLRNDDVAVLRVEVKHLATPSMMHK